MMPVSQFVKQYTDPIYNFIYEQRRIGIFIIIAIIVIYGFLSLVSNIIGKININKQTLVSSVKAIPPEKINAIIRESKKDEKKEKL